MKKEIRHVTESVLQVTTIDERWYARPIMNETTGLPERYEYVPSVTWIAHYYPKGLGFMKWLAEHGWDEAEAIKNAAGDKGSKVHQGALALFDRKPLAISESLLNRGTLSPEEIGLGEYYCLMTLVAWWNEIHEATGHYPRVLNREFVVWNDEDGYAGTIDLLVEIPRLVTIGHGETELVWDLWLLDLKTSQELWPEMELQLSAYKRAYLKQFPTERPITLGVLRLGYRRNRKGFLLSEIEDQYEAFLAAKVIWFKETKGVFPLQRDYPLKLQLAFEPEDAVPAGGIAAPEAGQPAQDTPGHATEPPNVPEGGEPANAPEKGHSGQNPDPSLFPEPAKPAKKTRRADGA